MGSKFCMWPLYVKEIRKKIQEGLAHEGTGGKADGFGAIH